MCDLLLLCSQVDEVLAQNKLTLLGLQAVSAVQFEHPGFVLCPIEDPSVGSDGSSGGCSGSNGGCSGSNAAPRLQTLGAFVSVELMEDSDRSSCRSEEEAPKQH